MTGIAGTCGVDAFPFSPNGPRPSCIHYIRDLHIPDMGTKQGWHWLLEQTHYYFHYYNYCTTSTVNSMITSITQALVPLKELTTGELRDAGQPSRDVHMFYCLPSVLKDPVKSWREAGFCYARSGAWWL